MFSFQLSPWQEESINALKEGNHSLVTAPTGSGKTVPVEFAIRHYVPQGKKIIYTSPIKALSNQKFNEFQRKFPDFSFGILTGDIKFNPEADVLIMTTEILRNHLFLTSHDSPSSKLDFTVDIATEVGCIVFDEVHYINDRDRGTIWEECFIMAPKSAQFLMLSATIDAPHKFANWISSLNLQKKVIHSDCNVRAVPLQHYFWFTCYENKIMEAKKKTEFDKFMNQPLLFRDSKGNYNDTNFFAVDKMKSYLYKNRIFVKRVHVFNTLIKYLSENNMLPAICFIYSRKNVERTAREVNCNLLSSEESQKVEGEATSILKKLDNWRDYVELPQFKDLVARVKRGVGIHHSGMLPIFREMVELLFERGYIKLLFATETFAVGLNMPTKTAIFSDLTKFDGTKMRFLEAHEYTQQAGRAGRRGFDTLGHVIHLNNLFDMPNLVDYKRILSNKPQMLESRFRISYNLIMNTIKNNGLSSISKESMMNQEINDEINQLTNELREIDNTIDASSHQVNRTSEDVLARYIELSELIPMSSNKIRKKLEREQNYIREENHFIDQDLKAYHHAKELRDSREQQERYIQHTTEYIDSKYALVKDILTETEFISDQAITPAAEIALQIKEANALTLTKLLLSTNSFASLTTEEIVAVLSCFCQVSIPFEERQDHPNSKNQTVNTTLNELITITNNFVNLEDKNELRSELDYELNFDLLDFCIDWCACNTLEECQTILRTHSHIFVGEFVKSLLKINNIAKELQEVAEYQEDLELLQKLKDIPPKLMKFIITNQSLYL